ncbi:ankyrin-3-like [Argiope bruennichi]|uniref:ankyrin-3-like n=1 Tax=Argiope bruennichi TaxID=94029 RepID=UPI00249559D2|nr:ankyrin-3-like [Argiope bruennichi]
MNFISGIVNEYNHERAPFGLKAELEQILIFLNYTQNPNLTDFFGTTLLHFAATDNYDNFEIVEKLIKAGANVNARNNCKQTPLHLAVLRHNWRVIDTLIAHNADINAKELKGNTALHFAIDLLWSKRKQDQQESRSWIVRKLLLCGADPNVPNTSRETPLMLAVRYGDLEIVKELLACGANVHLRNQYSETCLHLVSWSPQPDIFILQELVKHGACVSCCDDIGRTPLDVLLESDKIGSVGYLAESFIKTATLVHWEQKIVFQTNQNREKTRSLEEFMDKCFQEVSRMKSYVYSDESTLCHFAINGGKVNKRHKSQSIFDEVLDTLTKDDFPIYNDFIEAHFDREFLQEKLLQMNVYARNAKVYHFLPRQIVLNGRNIYCRVKDIALESGALDRSAILTLVKDIGSENF